MPAERFPLEVKGAFASEDEKRLLSETFLRLAQLWHLLPSAKAEDCLLLLTTCRNRWYTLNALYAEAAKWCQEADTYKGFGDAMDALRGAISGNENLERAAERAASILETTAECLSEFSRKHDLFFNRFHEVHSTLVEFAESTFAEDSIALSAFREAFVDYDTGPGPDDHLAPPDGAVPDPLLDRLLVWFGLAKPLTSLARTYISEVLQIGKAHEDTCKDYLGQLQSASVNFASYGYPCPDIPADDVFSWRLSAQPAEAVVVQQLTRFVSFCDGTYGTARSFLAQMLPGKENLIVRFPLNRPGDEQVVEIAGHRFQRVPNALTFINDMRNSTGDRYSTGPLKVLREDVSRELRREKLARSAVIYDDCSVLACDSLDAMGMALSRVWNALEVRQSRDGFAGLRVGAVCGEMLYDMDGDWFELMASRANAPPMDSSHNTMARASRLMNLDKERWTDSEQGKALRKSLDDWANDESLLFLDTSLYEMLPDSTRKLCRCIDVVQFSGVGPKQCWAIPIPKLAKLLAAG